MSLLETFYQMAKAMSTPKPQEPIIQRFGVKLHALRTRRGMTLKDLAFALGLSAHGYLSELEAGKKIPTIEFVVKAARLFGVTTDELLLDEVDLLDDPS